MTIVEFFDKTAIENVLSAMLCEPDRVIYVGDSAKRMKKAMAAYREVLEARGKHVELRYRTVGKNNLQSIVDTLTRIAETEPECIFNLDGGEDLYLVAVGMVYARLGDRVRLHRFNVKNNTITDCDADGNDQLTAPIAISTEENIRIYGGRVIRGQETEEGTYPWRYTPEFCRDIGKMWQICRENPSRWNSRISALNRLSCQYPLEGLELRVPRNDTALCLCDGKLPQLLTLLERLEQLGLIRKLQIRETEFGFVFKNEQIRQCLLKAGQLLEVYISALAISLEDQGEPVYNCVMTGVCIDWDGVLEEEGKSDVTNEIDVLMMKGAIPVFVSCKNGCVEKEELYKLSTVAERFGGKYAKKVLIASELDKMGAKGHYIRARAEDLDIRIVEDVDAMEEPELCRVLRSLWSN